MRPDWRSHPQSLRRYLGQRFADEFEPPEDGLVARTFAGDTIAAAELAERTTCAQRARLAVALWRACPHDDAAAMFGVITWKRCPTSLALALGDGDWRLSRHNMRRMVRDWWLQPAEDKLPDPVRVWRGTFTLVCPHDPQYAAGGFSWTIDRDAACWHALSRCERVFDEARNPAVFVATVRRSDINAFTQSDGEVILMNPPQASVDGELADWKSAAVRHETKRVSRAISQEKQP